ncbi:hypothetical protein [Deinococcus humi]|uniref:Uncharacterized protein n=1 Tax=Deinococcus humi TaxID=662880 RepID=A0A7W8JUY2_9DEIO|nr:hypothetical protein [Deinococcus humi]MBB5363415.1 hypothetical protein [Deinococcus humi]GGO26648.1 hypothetical protein GCM10008949_17560 [Deinococcus humi]
MKPLTPTRHGIVDYCACALMLGAPRLLKLSSETQAVSAGLAASYLGVTVFTDFPPALRRVLPFPLHGKIELGTLPLLLGLAAWRRSANERLYFLGLAGMVAGAYALTDWQANPDET